MAVKELRGFHIDSDLFRELQEVVRHRGGRKHGVTLSSVVNEALRQYLKADSQERKTRLVLPGLQELLDEKFAQTEAWLRPLAAGSRLFGAVATFLALELLAGSRIAPDQAMAVLDTMRGRAYKYLRHKDRGDPPRPEGQAS